MANNKKQVRDFIAVRELQYGTEQEFIQDIDKVIAECETDESMTNQLRFYKQVRKALMTKKEAIAILEKSFGKELQFRGSADWGGIPVWKVKSKNNFLGYFIIDNHEFETDTFAFIHKTEKRKTQEVQTELIYVMDYHNIEKFLTAVKHYVKNKL
jgi:hypothetical protein